MINNLIRKIVLGLISLFIFGTFNIVWAAGDIQDTLSNTAIGANSEHSIKYVVSGSEIITDGSIKIIFDSGFDLSAITSGDIVVTGGDVVWGGKLIDPGSRTIVVQFSGNLDHTDGEIDIEIGISNFVLNPSVVGTYEISFGMYATTDGTGVVMEGGQTKIHVDEGVQVTASIAETLVFTVSGVGSGQVVNGVGTNVVSSSDLIDFGTMLGAGTRVGAHDLSVLTNASYGYSVVVSSNHKLESGVNFVSDFVGTNISPVSWISPSGGIEGYFGYTTDDQSLANLPKNRFSGGKWAGLSSVTGYEVMYNDGPADGVTINEGKNRVGYRLEISDFQASGTYDMTLTYICVPSF